MKTTHIRQSLLSFAAITALAATNAVAAIWRVKPARNINITKPMKSQVIVAIFTGMLLVGSNHLAGATFYTVTSTADNTDSATHGGSGTVGTPFQMSSLRGAVIAANANAGEDTITLPAGTYTLTIPGASEDAAATGDLDIKCNLTITGAGAASTIVDGGGLDRVFQIHPGVIVGISGLTIQNGSDLMEGGGIASASTATVTLNNCTVQNDSAYNGGGIFSRGTMTLNNCIVSGNTAVVNGGGMYNYTGTMTINDSSIISNKTGQDGGGIINNVGTLILRTSSVSKNSAFWGGGVCIAEGQAEVLQSILGCNTATDAGGGIYCDFSGSMTLSDSGIVSNTAAGYGGGICCGGPLTVNNSRIVGNLATNFGGGIQYKGTLLAVNNSTISGNWAAGGGGINNGQAAWGCGATHAVANLTNSTLSGNSAEVGGGIRNNYSDAAFNNCTISANSASSTGGGISRSGGELTEYNVILQNTIVGPNTPENCEGAIKSLDYNLDSDGSCGLDQPHDLKNVSPLLLPLANNGGPTETHALLPGSPAIDAVPCASCSVRTDQRSILRPQGSACDIGAYEVNNNIIPWRDGQNLVLRWDIANWAMEFSTNFATNSWQPFPIPPSTNQVVIPIEPNKIMFFRLVRP